MTNENEIIIGIVIYWVISVVISLGQIYIARQKFLKWKQKKEAQMALEVINRVWESFAVNTWKKMNKYSKVSIVALLVPFSLLFIIAPPIFLPFEIMAAIVTIPNDIKKRKKKKEDEKIKNNFILFYDAVNKMDSMFDDEFKNKFKSENEYDAVINEHHHAGMFLRNGLSLWDTEMSLTKFFDLNGVAHADDMSTVLMRAFHRKLNGIEFRAEEIIKEKFESPNNHEGNKSNNIEIELIQ